MALDDNAVQSRKYTSSGTFQLLLKVCAARLHPQPEPGQLGIQMQYRSLRTSALSTTLVASVTLGKTAPRALSVLAVACWNYLKPAHDGLDRLALPRMMGDTVRQSLKSPICKLQFTIGD